MILGYDLSIYSGPADAGALVQLRNAYNLQRAILATQLTDWAEAAKRAAVPFEAYRFLGANGNWSSQIATDRDWCRTYGVGRYWLDVEDASGAPDAATLSAAVQEALTWSPRVGIYTRRDYWLTTLGNPQLGLLCQLWNANWTESPPDPATGFDAGFGGWLRAPAVQYAGDVTLCGVLLDLDAWDSQDVQP